VDADKIQRGVRLLLEGLGEDADREGLLDTPRRVSDMFGEILALPAQDLASIIVPMPADTHQEMVLVRDIAFHSMCEHHLLPFFGVVHVAYIPSRHGKITGLSKIARLVGAVSARLQLQERLTSTIADTMVASLDPAGVMVLVRAEHLCMTMRGVRAPGSLVVTSAVRGVFRTSAATRSEVLALIDGRA
jgi:GTP cyclohydrolase I